MKNIINIKVKNKEKNLRIDILLSNQGNKLSRSRVKSLILGIGLFYLSFLRARIKGTLINMGE